MASSGVRVYIYIMLVFSVLFLTFGIADLIRLLLAESWSEQIATSYGYGQSFSRDLSFRLAAILVSLPIWLFHLWFAHWRIAQLPSGQEKHTSIEMHKRYLFAISGVYGIIILFFLIWFVFRLINFFLGAQALQLRDFAWSFGYVPTAIVLGIWHFFLSRSKVLRGEEVVTKQVESQASISMNQNKKFCGKCGTANIAENKFCANCGAHLV